MKSDALREHLAYIARRLPDLDLEEQDTRAGVHPSVVTRMAAGESQPVAVERTLTVITNIRTHLRRRQAQFRRALHAS